MTARTILVAALIGLGSVVPGQTQSGPVTPSAVCNSPGSGAANKAAFDSAFATAAAVYVPSCPSNGCYYVDAFSIPANRTMFGDSRQTSCIRSATVPGGVFVAASSGVTIRDMRILTPLGTGPGFAGIDLYANAVVDLNISNVELAGEQCLGLTNAQEVIADRVNCSAHHSYALYSVGGQRITMTRWTIADASNYQIEGSGLICSSCSGFRAEDNWIGYNFAWGVYADTAPDTTSQAYDVIIRGNRVYTWVLEGIAVNNVNSAIMTENIIWAGPQHQDNCMSSASPNLNPQAQGLIFANNKMEGCGANGIDLSTSTAFSNVTGNIIVNNAGAGPDKGFCIVNFGAQNQRDVVVGNNCSNYRFNNSVAIRETWPSPGDSASWNLYGANGGIPGNTSYYAPAGSNSAIICSGAFC
jgi:hypothetical protein